MCDVQRYIICFVGIVEYVIVILVDWFDITVASEHEKPPFHVSYLWTGFLYLH